MSSRNQRGQSKKQLEVTRKGGGDKLKKVTKCKGGKPKEVRRRQLKKQLEVTRKDGEGKDEGGEERWWRTIEGGEYNWRMTDDQSWKKEGGEEAAKKVICSNCGHMMSVAMEQQTKTAPWWNRTRNSRHTSFHETTSEIRKNGGKNYEREKKRERERKRKRKRERKSD